MMLPALWDRYDDGKLVDCFIVQVLPDPRKGFTVVLAIPHRSGNGLEMRYESRCERVRIKRTRISLT